MRQEAWGLKDPDFKMLMSLFDILFINESYAGQGPTLEDSLELTIAGLSVQQSNTHWMDYSGNVPQYGKTLLGGSTTGVPL